MTKQEQETPKFSPKTKRELRSNAGDRCSNPSCRKPTKNVGQAAHIHAKSGAGPRGNPDMSHEQLRDYNNGIWLCSNCHANIDKLERIFPVELIRSWKRHAEENIHMDNLSGINMGIDTSKAISRLRAFLDDLCVPIPVQSIEDGIFHYYLTGEQDDTFRKIKNHFPQDNKYNALHPILVSMQLDIAEIYTAIDVHRSEKRCYFFGHRKHKLPALYEQVSKLEIWQLKSILDYYNELKSSPNDEWQVLVRYLDTYSIDITSVKPSDLFKFESELDSAISTNTYHELIETYRNITAELRRIVDKPFQPELYEGRTTICRHEIKESVW